ncbi:hypothetical protein HDU98_005189 [Podochytrium sp. JEL0797]|nr:hypothetical protein HDU98_005189 [Podochytrium sp. JEL0797]
MDPLFIVPPPQEQGTFSVQNPHLASQVTLAYEVHGTGPTNVMLVVGALATAKHFAQLASLIAQRGFRVLTFDHRGIGKSSATPLLETWTSEVLADDALQLMRHVFANQKVCLLGASMGGMVAQKMLARDKGETIQKLYLSVTARWYSPYSRYVPLPAGFYKFALPCFLPSTPKSMVEMIMNKTFDKEYLDAIHPRSSTGETYRVLWTTKWVEEYTDWFPFTNLDACASQSIVAQLHFLSDDEIAVIRESRVPVVVHVAEKDQVMAPKDERALAELLGAEVFKTEGGHVISNLVDFERYCESICKHFQE